MGINTRNLMNQSISSRRPIRMPQLIAAARLDNPSTTPIRIGEMRTFVYHASTTKLPYWDMFPLIFVIDIDVTKGILSGLNLHYLPLDLRKLFFRKLQMRINGFPHITPDARLRITYDVLSQSMQYAEFAPCYKNYLFRNTRSNFIKIDATEWEVAINLPVAPFIKSNMNTVYSDSRRKVFERRYG